MEPRVPIERENETLSRLIRHFDPDVPGPPMDGVSPEVADQLYARAIRQTRFVLMVDAVLLVALFGFIALAWSRRGPTGPVIFAGLGLLHAISKARRLSRLKKMTPLEAAARGEL